MRRQRVIARLALCLGVGLVCVAGGLPAGSVAHAASSETSAPSKAELFGQHIRQGDAHSEKFEFAAAIEAYTKALAIDPQSVAALLGRGDAYRMQRKYPEALADFTKLIGIYPFTDAYMLRGMVHAFSGDDDAALADYNKVIELEPDLPAVYKQRAYVHLRRKEFDRAEADIRWALDYAPRDANFRHSYGDVLFYAGKLDEARRQWDKACRLADAATVVFWQMGLTRAGLYSQERDGQCDDDLISAFAACAEKRCQF